MNSCIPGTVNANSPGEGRGATFTVKLSLESFQEERNVSGLVPPNAAAGASSQERLPLVGLRVLVIDDETDTLEMFATALKRYGAEVVAVASAAAAMSAMEVRLPDIIVSDIGMSGEDGYELIRKVRALPPEGGGRIPALALTAYARTEDKSRALSAGYQMHLAKPVELTDLLAAVAKLAGQATLIRFS